MDHRIWSIMHDGTITAIQWQAPSEVRFTIELEYLRQEFEPQGLAFELTIAGCTLMTFIANSTLAEICEASEIVRYDLEILTADAVSGDGGGAIEIMLNSGVLRLQYNIEQVQLDSGEKISYDSLREAAARSLRRA